MAGKILAILDQKEGRLNRFSFETAAVAKKIADEIHLETVAVVMGNEINNINEISKYGLFKAVYFKNENLEKYSPSAYCDIITDFVKETGAEYLLFSNTSTGKDLAPRVSIRINAGCIMDCIKLDSSTGEIIATRPVYAGKALVDVKLKTEIKIFTIRGNVFKAIPSGNGKNPEIEFREIKSPNLKTRMIEFRKSQDKIDVAEADIIVSGGRGLKGPENFYLIENLAEVLGAAVGASRAVVDAGWRPHQEQVGQTGKTVSPSLYIACGISGAIQHLAGMSSSKYIVAINKDKEAPIFSVADYGIAGDVFEIIPALTEEIKKIKSS
jgi:electron transfer flavoprotein alpha subunit